MEQINLSGIPDEVMARLKRMAALEGLSLNALVLRELTQISGAFHNARLLSSLPDVGVAPSDILDGLDEGRASR